MSLVYQFFVLLWLMKYPWTKLVWSFLPDFSNEWPTVNIKVSRTENQSGCTFPIRTFTAIYFSSTACVDYAIWRVQIPTTSETGIILDMWQDFLDWIGRSQRHYVHRTANTEENGQTSVPQNGIWAHDLSVRVVWYVAVCPLWSEWLIFLFLLLIPVAARSEA